MQQDCGVDTRLVSPEELLALFPEVSVDDIALGAWEPRSGYANPVRTVEALVRSAEARWGLMVSEDTEVVDITLDGTKVTGVVTTGGTVATDTVVNCAGPWAPQIARMVGLDYDFSLSLEYEAVFALPDGFRGVPIFSDAINLSYFRPAGPGRILVGEGYPKEQEPVANPDVYQDGPDTRTVRRLAERLAARVPALAPSLLSDELVGSYLEGYSGVYDITPDWNPIVGGVAGVTGYYAAAGGSGHCFKIGPPIGEALADVIVGGRPAIDVASLGHARFSERELLGSVWGPGNRA
jgi:sarcosine oxidase subunit beta